MKPHPNYYEMRQQRRIRRVRLLLREFGGWLFAAACFGFCVSVLVKYI